MKSINFTLPIQLSKESYAQYAAAGLRFGGLKEAHENQFEKVGFTQVEVSTDNDTLAENISKLGYKATSNLISYLHDSEIGPALYKAKDLWLLETMGEKNESGYAFSFLGEQPRTWKLQDKIAPEIKELNNKLSEQGITQVRIGQELEFGLPEKSIDGFTHWQDVKSSIISELQADILQADAIN